MSRSPRVASETQITASARKSSRCMCIWRFVKGLGLHQFREAPERQIVNRDNPAGGHGPKAPREKVVCPEEQRASLEASPHSESDKDDRA